MSKKTKIIGGAIVGVVAVGAGLFGKAIPAGFVPDEDQGIIGFCLH